MLSSFGEAWFCTVGGRRARRDGGTVSGEQGAWRPLGQAWGDARQVAGAEGNRDEGRHHPGWRGRRRRRERHGHATGAAAGGAAVIIAVAVAVQRAGLAMPGLRLHGGWPMDVASVLP